MRWLIAGLVIASIFLAMSEKKRIDVDEMMKRVRAAKKRKAQERKKKSQE